MSSTGSAAGPPRDWPAVDGRFRYVERRSTAVRKGRAGRSSDLVRAKPRPTRKTFRDVEQAPSFHRETAIPGAGFRFQSVRTFEKFRLPPSSDVFFSSRLIKKSRATTSFPFLSSSLVSVSSEGRDVVFDNPINRSKERGKMESS